jgi:hypothetical protein
MSRTVDLGHGLAEQHLGRVGQAQVNFAGGRDPGGAEDTQRDDLPSVANNSNKTYSISRD